MLAMGSHCGLTCIFLMTKDSNFFILFLVTCAPAVGPSPPPPCQIIHICNFGLLVLLGFTFLFCYMFWLLILSWMNSW